MRKQTTKKIASIMAAGMLFTTFCSNLSYASTITYNSEASVRAYVGSISKLTTSTLYTTSTSINGTTTAGATVKAYYGSKQIGKTATADKYGNYKITSIPKQPKGRTIKVQATKKNYKSKSVNIVVKTKQVSTSSTRLPFVSNGKLGYMDEKGNVAIKPTFNYYYNEMYDDIEFGHFNKGVAKVYTSSYKVRYINSSGKYINNYTYDYGYDFSEGMAVAYRNGKARFIDASGKEFYSTTKKVGGCLVEGLLIFKDKNYNYGYMDKTGKVVIKANFAIPSYFHNGYAKVEYNNGTCGIIDKKGNNKTKNVKLDSYINYEGYDYPVVGENMFAYPTSRGYVYADINNPKNIKIYKQKINGTIYGFEMAGIFYNGVASVQVNGKWGVIDKSGKMIIQPKYDYEVGFNENGYAVAWKGSQRIIINKQGKEVSKKRFSTYDGNVYMQGKLICINDGKKIVYYDLNGNKINPKL